MKTLIFVLCLIQFATCSVHAHADRIITLEGNKLLGLPKKYQPATFSLKENKLRIKNHEMVFAQYIKCFFSEEKCQLEFSASWYHDLELSPPYLLIRISPEDRDYHYQLLFDMDSLRLIEAQVVTHQKGSSRYFSIEIPDSQMKEIRNSIGEVEAQGD